MQCLTHKSSSGSCDVRTSWLLVLRGRSLVVALIVALIISLDREVRSRLGLGLARSRDEQAR